MKSYGEMLSKFLTEALNNDPRCKCGCNESQHSDNGPCYGHGDCDYFYNAGDTPIGHSQVSPLCKDYRADIK